MAGAGVLASAGMVVVVVSCETIVAASSCSVVTGIVFGILSSISGEAQSHFTQKCKMRVAQEATTAGKLFSRFSYQSSAPVRINTREKEPNRGRLRPLRRVE